MSWASDEITTLRHNKRIDKYGAGFKFRLAVETVDFAPNFGNGDEEKNVVQIEAGGGANAIKQGVVLFRG